MADWQDTGCGGPGVRQNADGTFEVEGDGVRVTTPPAPVFGWADLVNTSAAKYGVPAHLVAGIMSFESGGKSQVSSPDGAQGLMELLPSTARSLAGAPLTLEQIRDPATNIDLGTKFLAQLWQKYGGNAVKVAYAYNAGSARCGAGRSKVPAEAHAPCVPNRFGLVADCYTLSRGTIDYAGPVLAYANGALASGRFSGQAPTPTSLGSVAPSGPGGAVAAVGALLLLGYTVWRARSGA